VMGSCLYFTIRAAFERYGTTIRNLYFVRYKQREFYVKLQSGNNQKIASYD